MENIKFGEITNLEEYRAYNRKKSKEWYKNNREKKLKYQRERYYNLQKTEIL